MKEILKKLFGCWHDYREVSGDDWHTILMCRKCGNKFTRENY